MAEERMVTFDEFVKLAEATLMEEKEDAGFSFIDSHGLDDVNTYWYRFGKTSWYDSSLILIGGYGGYTTATGKMNLEDSYGERMLEMIIVDYFTNYLCWTDNDFENTKIKVEFD